MAAFQYVSSFFSIRVNELAGVHVFTLLTVQGCH